MKTGGGLQSGLGYTVLGSFVDAASGVRRARESSGMDDTDQSSTDTEERGNDSLCIHSIFQRDANTELLIGRAGKPEVGQKTGLWKVC